MGTLYRVLSADCSVEEMIERVANGEVEGVETYVNPNPDSRDLWPVAFRDERLNYLWPEGDILHHWGRNSATNLIETLSAAFNAVIVSEHDPLFYK